MARSIYFYTDSHILGGAELALLALIDSLDRAAWEPTLLLEDVEGIEAIGDPAREREVPIQRISPLPLGLAGARRVPGMARLLREDPPDVFHAHMSGPLAAKYGLAAAALARRPAVIATVQLVPDFEPKRSSILQLRLLSMGVDRYIAVSHDIAAQLAERFGWPREKIEVVHNAVDLERFDERPAPRLRDELAGGPERPVVLTCARLHEQKGLFVLLDAAALVPDARFVIAGEGPQHSALEARTAELGLGDRVLFLGHRDDVPALLSACDVFALPSLYEGSSLAVLEAMAAGRPVVTSSIGGTVELVEDGISGLLVPPGDAAALARALRRVLSKPDLRADIARRARESVERGFTVPAMSDRVVAVYERALRERNGSDG